MFERRLRKKIAELEYENARIKLKNLLLKNELAIERKALEKATVEKGGLEEYIYRIHPNEIQLNHYLRILEYRQKAREELRK